MSDEVRVVIEGKEFTGWEAVTIDMAVDGLADAFSITAPWDPGQANLRAALRGYNRVELYIDDDRYLTGRIDKAEPSLASADRTIKIEGRSLTGVLADCSIKGTPEFSGLTLATISRQVCKPFGITVRADSDTAAIPETRVEYGQRAVDYLKSLATPRNRLLNCSFKGELVLSSGAALAGQAPVARIIEGEWPVEAVSGSRDWTRLFSYYEVATQFAGISDIVGSRSDADVKVYRPILAAAGETDADLGATAARLRAQALADGAPTTVTVSGWRRPDGKRWAERQIVSFRAPSAMVYEEIPLLISECKLSMSASGGQTAVLNLVLPETYSNAMPKNAGKLWAL